MLTIQPKISTQYARPKNLTFRGESNVTPEADNDSAIYKEKTEFYENKVKEFDEAIQDKNTPGIMKKVLKIFRVASEALLEGWAVAWGAKKGSNIIKSSVVKTVEGKTAQEVSKEILTPFGKWIKKAGNKVSKSIKTGIEFVKNSKITQSITETFANLAEKMRQNSVGKYVVKGFEYIGKAIKYVAGLVTSGFNKIANHFKGKSASEMYDKTAKVTSTTLGVGAGAAGAYNAATGKDRDGVSNVDETQKTVKKVSKTDIEDIEDDDDNIENNAGDEFEEELQKSLEDLEEE